MCRPCQARGLGAELPWATRPQWMVQPCRPHVTPTGCAKTHRGLCSPTAPSPARLHWPHARAPPPPPRIAPVHVGCAKREADELSRRAGLCCVGGDNQTLKTPCPSIARHAPPLTVALATRKLASELTDFTSVSLSFMIFFTRAKGITWGRGMAPKPVRSGSPRCSGPCLAPLHCSAASPVRLCP